MTTDSAPPTPNYRFGRELHLRKQADFDRVYAARIYAADNVLIVNACASELAHPRLGLSVSRKVGIAVVRNRWKRLIREAFRLSRAELPAGIDLVVRPQKGAEPDFAAISRSLPAQVSRLAKRIAREQRSEVRGQASGGREPPEVRSGGS